MSTTTTTTTTLVAIVCTVIVVVALLVAAGVATVVARRVLASSQVLATATTAGNGNMRGRLFATGFDAAVGLRQRTPRYYYVWEKQGLVWRIDAVTGARRVVLDKRRAILDELGVADRNDERGLVGLAFHPDVASNGRVFVAYSAPPTAAAASSNGGGNGGGGFGINHVARLAEFAIRDMDGADEQFVAERVLLDIPQQYAYHHAQTLEFGPRDALLYYSTGDGGPQRDPDGNAQNPFSLKGKMLRIDVDRDTGGGRIASGRAYGIPAGNPFADGAAGAPEVIAVGLRNPWRFSFDASGERAYVGDVGFGTQESIKELDVAPFNNEGGAAAQPVNFGWPVYEGTVKTAFGASQALSVEPVTMPTFTYETGGALGRAVIGGYTVSDGDDDDMERYVFTDHVSAKLMTLHRRRRRRSPNGAWTLQSALEPARWLSMTTGVDGVDGGGGGANDDSKATPALLPAQVPMTRAFIDAKKNAPAMARDLAGNLYVMVWAQVAADAAGGGGRSAVYRLVPASATTTTTTTTTTETQR